MPRRLPEKTKTIKSRLSAKARIGERLRVKIVRGRKFAIAEKTTV